MVANHALLALDAFTGAPVLPEHDAVVLDEAHEFVASATDALSHELGRPTCGARWPRRPTLLGVSGREKLQDAADALEGLLATTEPGWLRVVPPHVLDVLALVESLLRRRGRGGRSRRRRPRRGREGRPRAGPPGADGGRGGGGRAAVAGGAQRGLRRRRAGRGAPAGEPAVGRRRAGARAVRRPDGRRDLRHAHAGRALRPHRGSARAAPARRAPRSATPTRPWSPSTSDDELPQRWRSLDVGSPFDHPRQGQLYVAADLPPPSAPGWAPAVDALLVELVRAAGGRTLALFSSTAAATRAAAAVRAALDLPVLLQGEDSAGALAHRFAADARTCLFGTRSFWQGVDVPGSACQLVVIDRIPFAHVDDPLVQARLEAAGAAGFASVTLPPAAVLLAQGAGRLVRSAGDRGVVAVLDPRLATASYAGLLLRTLPDFYRARSLEGVLASLRAIDASAPPVAPVGRPPAQRRPRPGR